MRETTATNRGGLFLCICIYETLTAVRFPVRLTKYNRQTLACLAHCFVDSRVSIPIGYFISLCS
jgi:hypothetical protein